MPTIAQIRHTGAERARREVLMDLREPPRLTIPSAERPDLMQTETDLMQTGTDLAPHITGACGFG